MPTARYLGTRALKSPSEHTKVGRVSKHSLHQRVVGESKGWGCVTCVCSVAVVEQPDPDVSLPPCTGRGMWDNDWDLDKPCAQELSLPLVLHHTREISLCLLAKPPWSTGRWWATCLSEWGRDSCFGPLFSTGHYKRHKPGPWAGPFLHCMNLCLKSHTGPLFFLV